MFNKCTVVQLILIIKYSQVKLTGCIENMSCAFHLLIQCTIILPSEKKTHLTQVIYIEVWKVVDNLSDTTFECRAN
jgi:hypothetical protein